MCTCTTHAQPYMCGEMVESAYVKAKELHTSAYSVTTAFLEHTQYIVCLPRYHQMSGDCNAICHQHCRHTHSFTVYMYMYM